MPGTAVYGIQEIPVKKPLKAKFERSKTELNEKASKIRPSIKTSIKPKAELNQRNPIKMDPLIPTKQKKDIPTFRSSPGNPLSHHKPETGVNGKAQALRSSSRYAARIKFEELHSKSEPVSTANKFEGQREALENVKQTKTKETSLLNGHPHGVPQGVIYRTRPQGLSIPGFGYGTPSCRS